MVEYNLNIIMVSLFIILSIMYIIIYHLNKKNIYNNMRYFNIKKADDLIEYLVDRELNYYLTINNINMEIIESNGQILENVEVLEDIEVNVINEILKSFSYDNWVIVSRMYSIKNKNDLAMLLRKVINLKIYAMAMSHTLIRK